MHIPENLIPIVGICCPFFVAVVAIICGAVDRISRQRGEANLKAMMIQRGMSAADIERVLAASASGSRSTREIKSEIPAEKPIAAATRSPSW